LLTSKEIIERTGISRATLNNYIASGLLPRPRVLPPGPEHGAAPRIGYFPDDAIERVETIQRLKREGWSITRMAEFFAAGGAAPGSSRSAEAGGMAPAAASGASAASQVPAHRPVQVSAPVASSGAGDFAPAGAFPRLTPANSPNPAWLVNERFRLVWVNEEARQSPVSPFVRAATAGSVFEHLLRLDADRGREALLRFHLEAAKARGALPDDLFTDLPEGEPGRLQELYRQLDAEPAQPLVAQLPLPASAVLPARWAHAVHFREGVLFALSPRAADAAARQEPVAEAIAAPTLTPVAVLVAMVQDAPGLWVRLSAEEYFELLNEIGTELDAVFRQHGGRTGRPVAEVLACYFLPQPGGSYLWDALAAAHAAREAMHQVSQRWQVRKGWDLELCLNVGIDEGQDWLGALGTGARGDLRVLGDAADRAGHLARCSRMGAILLTRNLLGKLSRDERQRLRYGVPRLDAAQAEAPLLFTFARLGDVAAPGTAPAGVADLAVAELLDLHSPHSRPPGGAR
jgi:adenylate cyclase